jgi:RNA polymerase sigma-70 factor, ECF subfamily
MPSLDDWGDLTPYLAYLKNRARSLKLNPRLSARFGESDLVQETFLRAQKSEVPCQGTSLRERMAYLDQAFDRVFIDHLREHHAEKRDIDKEQALQQALNESTAEYRLEPADKGASPSEQATRGEEFLRAMAGIDELPENERNVVLLTYLQGLSVQEAADRLGISRGQAAGLYARGTTRLRAFLNPEAGE